MKRPLLTLIAIICLLFSSCSSTQEPSDKPQSDIISAQTSDLEKIQKAGMHPVGEAIELTLRDEKHLTQTINSFKLVVKPQELDINNLTLQSSDVFTVDENGTIAPEMIFDNTDKQPVSMIMINYTIKNNATKSCTFDAGSRIYRIDSETYKIIDAKSSYDVSQTGIEIIYLAAEKHNGNGRENWLITLLPDEEITVDIGYLVYTKMLDSMLGCSLNPYGTNIKSGIAEVVLGYAK